MALRVNTNVEAFNAHRNLSATSVGLSKSMEKLSSGLRINRAADDAAGLAISEGMRAQIRGTAQASRNAQDGISLVQTAEGSLNEMHSILQRVRELSIQFANGTLSTSDQAKITAEVAQLTAELVRIRDSSKFNGIALFSSSAAVDGHDPGRRQRQRRRGEQHQPRRHHHRPDRLLVRLDGRARSTPRSPPCRRPRQPRCAAEPARAHHREPRRVAGEPVRLREPHPRRGRGPGDGELHQAPDPVPVRHRHAGSGQPGPAGRPLAPPAGSPGDDRRPLRTDGPVLRERAGRSSLSAPSA